MQEMEELLKNAQVKNYREFSTKSKVRLIIFTILSFIFYLVCTVSLFFGKGFIVPAVSFILLFLLIYFLALDCYRIKFHYVLLVLSLIFIFETLSFIILLGFSRYLVVELVLFNIAIGILLFLLVRQLNNSTGFSPFSYFTQGGFFVVSLITIFFCVLLMGKYTQIPFTCDDIDGFSTKIMDTTTNPFKNTRNKITSWFKNDKEENLNIPDLLELDNPMSKSEDLASAEHVESFFMNIRNTIETQTVGVKKQVSKSTCSYYIKLLQRVQKSGGIQIAGIFIGYLLLVGVFKILLRVVSIIGFMLFIILRIFAVYKYEKRMVEKEVIV